MYICTPLSCPDTPGGHLPTRLKQTALLAVVPGKLGLNAVTCTLDQTLIRQVNNSSQHDTECLV